MTLHLIPEPEEKGSELLRDLAANDNGANRWHLHKDLKQSNKFRMEVVVPSWKQHLLQLERMTKNEKDILLSFSICGSIQILRKNGSHFLWKRKFSTGE